MRFRLVLPLLYLAVAVWAWIEFITAPPDGLANLGLIAAVLPVSLAGLALTWAVGAVEFVLIPKHLAYVTAHAVFYVPSVLAVAALLYGLGRLIDRRGAGTKGRDSASS